MEYPMLSVFIPVFNAEKYLVHCLDSVVKQTYRNLEIIIYNDGSSDRSGEICQEFARQDNRIRYYARDNGHYREEINAFIANAKGEYLGFVDNDDYLDLDYFEKMLRMLEENHTDCVISSYTLVDSDEKELPWSTPSLENGLVLSREEVLKRFLTTLDIEGFRWNKIYKTSVFRENGITVPALFPSDINVEFELLSATDKVVLLDNRGYYYRQSAGSEVASMSLTKTGTFMETFDRIGGLAEKAGLTEEGEYYRIWRRINMMFNTWKSRKKATSEEWRAFKKKCGWKKTVKHSLMDALRIIYSYKNTLKFAIKTVIVWFAY